MRSHLRVYRVQGADGRGPFRPGFSREWLDTDRGVRDLLPPWTEEFGLRVLDRLEHGEIVGCGVQSIEGITRWFSPSEQKRLGRLGFGVVALADVRVIAESEHQVLFARLRPLWDGALHLPWPDLAVQL